MLNTVFYGVCKKCLSSGYAPGSVTHE
jgi:hypothetical protein